MDSSMMAAALRSAQSAVSYFALDKAMGKDAQSMAVLLADLQAANPTPQLARPAGSMDIRA